MGVERINYRVMRTKSASSPIAARPLPLRSPAQAMRLLLHHPLEQPLRQPLRDEVNADCQHTTLTNTVTPCRPRASFSVSMKESVLRSLFVRSSPHYSRPACYAVSAPLSHQPQTILWPGISNFRLRSHCYSDAEETSLLPRI